MRRASVSCAFLLLTACAPERPPTTPAAPASMPPHAGSDAPPLTVRAAGWVDVPAGAVTRDALLRVEGDRITSLSGPATPGCVVDVGEALLVPGLIDAHTHLLHLVDARGRNDSVEAVREVSEASDASRALMGAFHARSMLEHGFTTVRDLGNSGSGGDVALRDAIRKGWVSGPHVLATGRAISAAGGQFGRLAPLAHAIVDHEYVVVSGVDEARRAVRDAVAAGADGIKIIVGSETAVTLSKAEVKEITDEAHRLGRWVAAHATDDAAAKIACEARVDTIEHGYELSDETLACLVDGDIALVPTDGPREFYRDTIRANPFLDRARAAKVERATLDFVEGSRRRLRRAYDAGVRIVAGSDAYYSWGERSRGEIASGTLLAYAEAGLPPIEVLKAATTNAAKALRLGPKAGEIAVGAPADFIAVEGDPTRDVTALLRVVLVVKDGKVAWSRKSTGCEP